MPILRGATSATKMYVGSTPAQKVYLGTKLAWSSKNTTTYTFTGSTNAPVDYLTPFGVDTGYTVANGIAKNVNSPSGYQAMGATYHAETLGRDTFTQIRMAGPPTANAWQGLCLRAKWEGKDLVYLIANGSAVVIGNFKNGALENRVQANGISWAAGDIMRAEVIGSVYRLMKNGQVICTWDDNTGAFTTGGVRPGFMWYANQGNYAGGITQWSGGEL